jgi:hypothetical protein
MEYGLISAENIAPELNQLLRSDFQKLKNHVSSLTDSKQTLVEEWKLNRFLEALLLRQMEVTSAIGTVESAAMDQASLRSAVAERLSRQLAAANKQRKAINGLPDKIHHFMDSDISTFLNRLENLLRSIGDDFGSNYLIDQYQKEMQGITQKLNEGVKKIIQEELNQVHSHTVSLADSDLSLKASQLPSHTMRQQEMGKHMAASGLATAIATAGGFFLLGPIGGMIASGLVQSSVQSSAIQHQRNKMDDVYKEILASSRSILTRVKNEVTQSVKDSTTRFESEWLQSTKNTQWQILELATYASTDKQSTIKDLKLINKKIECGIKECQIATIKLRRQ